MSKQISDEELFKLKGYFKAESNVIVRLCEKCGYISDNKICPKCKAEKEYKLTEFYKYSKKQ